MARRQIDLPEEHADVFIAHLHQTLANAVAHRALQLLDDHRRTCFLALAFARETASPSCRQHDADHAAPRRVAARHLQANLRFLAGFAVMAAVVNLMLTRQLPWPAPTPPALAPAGAVIPADEAAAISALPAAR